MTRRHLLTAAAATSAAAVRAQDPRRAEPPRTDLFPELKSRRSEPKPISTEERFARIERAKQLMAEQKINAILLAGGSTLQYFTGVRWGNSERLLLMVLPARGEPIFISPAFEEDRAREQITLGLGARQQVFTWQEDESPYDLAAVALKERGIATGRLGVEETVKFVFSDGLGKAAASATLASATSVTSGCRGVKSAAELALMKFANQITLQAYEAAFGRLKEGMTNAEFGGLIAGAHAKLGFPGYAMVLVDESAALPHGSVKPQRIKDGSLILIDGGCAVENYQSDISRTFVLGKPTDKMKTVFDIVYRAQTAALKAARPGLACESVDMAARKVVIDAGFGPGYKYFTHRLGHGIGMDGHEWPYLVKGNKLPLAPGMTFSDEPGIYILGEFGVRLEDDMFITAGGAELFTPQSLSLEKPFGRV
ncbi:MAG: Xaa-Pro peptidase family protein [Bryobacteraceae bacterium]|nr:Xaa-Pro peptidase family protein [Bryobacteraceae bacterium]